MSKQQIIEIGPARRASTSDRLTQPQFIRELPDLPVFPETLLKFELAIHERPVELAGVSDLLLSDPGAAIQVMRTAGRNWEGDDPAERIEDAISSLGVKTCLHAMSNHTLTRGTSKSAILNAWEHASVIAHQSGFLTQEFTPNAPPGDARWVGLCHEIGSWPAILGWAPAGERAIDPNLMGLSMAQAWGLPPCVEEYFSDRLNAKADSPWSVIVDQAHKRTERTSLRQNRNCPQFAFDLQQDTLAV